MGEAAERSDPPLIRMSRRRESPWVQVRNELIDLYQPHIGGFAGSGYWTYRRRFVNHDPANGWRGRAFPNKRQLKSDGQVGADRLRDLGASASPGACWTWRWCDSGVTPGAGWSARPGVSRTG